MSVSQKCQYALRALFELGRQHGNGPTPISQIAETQVIPPRFLELILGEMKKAGFVQSRRGKRGGYLLARDPARITVGDVIRFIDGPTTPVRCVAPGGDARCPMHGDCAFQGLWQAAREAVEGVYDATTLQDLLARDPMPAADQGCNFSI